MKYQILNTIGLCLVLAAAGCGGGSEEAVHPLVGTYSLDLTRTLESNVVLQGAAKSEASEARLQLLRDRFGPDAYHLSLRNDRSFALVVREGEGSSFELAGRWEDTGDALTLQATSANGVATDADAAPREEVRVDGPDTLVLGEGEQQVFLVRQ